MHESDDEQSEKVFYYHESNNNKATKLKMTIPSRYTNVMYVV